MFPIMRRRALRLATANALCDALRDFDVLGRVGEDQFEILLPDPGSDTHDRVSSLARCVADRICRDPALNEPVRVGLAFGYAVHGPDGVELESLAALAAEPRIELV